MNANDSNDDIPMRDVYEGVDYDLNTYTDEHEGQSTLVIGEGFNHGYTLSEIDGLVGKVASSKGLGFKISKDVKGKTKLQELELGKYFKSLNFLTGEVLQYPAEIFTLSPRAKVFAESCYEQNLMMEVFTNPGAIHKAGVTGADLFNSLVTCIRNKTESSEFKKQVKSLESNCKRNLKNYTNYFNKLLDRYARLLTLRVDLYFPKDKTGQFTVEKAHESREHFLNNMRSNQLFDDLKGLIWKLEYGRERGYHFHYIFFFDGTKHQQEAWLAEEIGKYWIERITGGKGSDNNCNKNPNQYKRRGIGQINHDDIAKREIFLREVLGYLVKETQCLILKRNKGRSIGRMEMPKARTSATGRPRKQAMQVLERV